MGLVATIGALLSYRVVLPNLLINGGQDFGLLEEISFFTMVLVLLGLGLLFVGITYCFHRKRPDRQVNPSSETRVLQCVLRGGRYFRIFLISALIYGMILAITSGTFVFRPGANFSVSYGVAVPSVVTVVCCGQFGEMPQLVIYLTQNFAILLVPLNLIILLTASWLVGLNAGIAVLAYKSRMNSGTQWFSGLGAVLGLFTACPTCAGLFLMSVLGVTSTLVLTVGSLQGVFLLTGISSLVIAPIVSSRQIVNGSLHMCATNCGGTAHHET